MSLGSTQSWLVGRASNNTSQSPSQVNMKTTHDYHFRIVTIDWNIYKEFQTLEILGETIYQQPQWTCWELDASSNPSCKNLNEFEESLRQLGSRLIKYGFLYFPSIFAALCWRWGQLLKEFLTQFFPNLWCTVYSIYKSYIFCIAMGNGMYTNVDQKKVGNPDGNPMTPRNKCP